MEVTGSLDLPPMLLSDYLKGSKKGGILSINRLNNIMVLEWFSKRFLRKYTKMHGRIQAGTRGGGLLTPRNFKVLMIFV